MAVQLPNKLYVDGTYLDANISVADITELSQKVSSNGFFLGMEVKMPEAFYGVNENPYPIDFWSTPYGEDIKWEIKTMPSIETAEDLEYFKRFVENFKDELKYYPLADGFEFLVDGEKYVFGISSDGQATYTKVQSLINDNISGSIKTVIEELLIPENAKESLDTLEEISAWIQNHPEDAALMNAQIVALQESAHTHENKGVLDGITAEKVAAWDAAEANASAYTDSAITVATESFNWILADGEKHRVRFWRGTRANYELLAKNGVLDNWTRYTVIDTIDGVDRYIEYFGSNQISEPSGQLLPVKSIIGDITEIEGAPYDRYLVGADGVGYKVYEYVIDADSRHKWIIKDFDYRYGIRVIDRGLKNYVYVNNTLKTYDDVDCGDF